MDADGLSGCVQLEGFSVGEEDCGMMGGNCGQRLFSTRPHRVSADSCWFFRSRSSPFSVVLSTHVWQGSLELNKTSRVSFALCTSYPLCINRSCLPLFSTRVFHAKSTILRFPSPAVLDSFITLAGVNLVHDPQSDDIMKACDTRRHMRAGTLSTVLCESERLIRER